jgi:AAA domain
VIATTYDAWVLSRIMGGLPVGSEVAGMTAPMRNLAEGLRGKDPDHRGRLLEGFAIGLEQPSEFLQSIVDARPTGPAPEPDAGTTPGAHLGDVRRIFDSHPWLWPGWLAGGAMTALASDAGIGKTLLALTLARALWTNGRWPDGQENPLPAGTKTLWVPGDQHYHQLMEVARAYGIPDEAILLNRPAHDPIGDLDLDDAGAVEALARRIEADRPGLVIVDTVGQVTARNLGRAEEAREFFQPLMTVASKTGTSFLMLTHLSREGDPLGRRIIAACRVVWKLSQPDKEGQPDRRKLWVDKSYSLKPPPLGMTIAAEGCTFDFEPPAEAPKDKGGRPPAKLEPCKQWLLERLTPVPVPLQDLRTEAEEAGYDANVLYRARDILKVSEYKYERRKWWKLPAED